MRSPRLSSQEKDIENALLEGTYKPVTEKEFHDISEAINRRKKDAVLNIRVNGQDLENIKRKAKKFGIRYQTLISEILHKVAL